MKADDKEPSILLLPTELLIEIFEYVPYRWDISQVCRTFYEVLCTVDRNFHKLVVNDEKTVCDCSTN